MASYYFPHDNSARNDPKMQELLIEMGVAGIGLYWCIVEQLYEQDNVLPMKSCKNIAFTYHVKETDVRRLITEFDLFENDGVNFWSASVGKRIKKQQNISEARRQSAYKMHEIHHANARKNDANANETNANANKSDANAMKTQAKPMQPLCKTEKSGCKPDANKINKEIKKEREINKEKEAPLPPVISGLLAKAEDLRNDVYRLHGDWVEIFCMNNGIRMTDFRIWMDEFVKMLQNRNERKTMQDFQSHFASWFKIQYDHAKAKRAKTEVYDYAKQEMERQGEEIRKRHDEAKENKITFEEYQELKKRAEAGDVEAKKIIGL